MLQLRVGSLSLPTLSHALWIGALCFVILGPGTTTALAQPLEISGLQAPGLVIYDSNGIPHICSGSDRDTILLLGYVHAQDRFFQMDTLRRTFSGTLAELVGPNALASDVQFRTFGLRRAAEESLAAYSAAGLTEMLDQLDAYTRGVNHFLATQPLPPEYAALELTQAAPWTPIDSIVLGKGLGFGLSFDLVELDLTVQAAAYAQAGAAGGFDGMALLFEDTSRTAPFDPTISIPDSATAQQPKAAPNKIAAPNPRAVALASQYLEKASQVPLLKKALNRRDSEAGSNWWVLSGNRTDSGMPMLASDPHLGLNTPATWYEVHLISSSVPGCGLTTQGTATVFGPAEPAAKAPPAKDNHTGLNVNGVSFAGVPGLALGCNDVICWGATVHPMDVTDVYQEELVLDPTLGLPVATIFDGQQEPLVAIPQAFNVNQVGDGTADNLADAGIGPLDGGLSLVVPRRNNGPIIALDISQQPVTALSVQYTGWRGTLELEAFRRFLSATDTAEFKDALTYFDVGSQNFSYADIHGNIAYFTSAEMPIREDLQTLGTPAGDIPPFLIRDGTHTLPHEWMAVQNPQPQQALNFEILPFDEMPQVENPASGFVLNANNDPVGTSLDNNPLNQLRPGGGIYYLSPGYADGNRMGRIARMMDAILADGGKASLDDLKTMQSNNQLLDAELTVPFLTGAFANATAAGAPAELAALAQDPGVAEAVARLMNWDFSTPTGIVAGYDPGDDPDNLPEPDADEIASSVAATLWSIFRGQVVQNVIDGTLTGLGLGAFTPGSTLAYTALSHHLTSFDTNRGVGASGVNFFPGPDGYTPEQARDLILLQNLRSALDLLASDTFADAFANSTDQNDYRWGNLHRIELDHLLGGPFSIPPAGGFQPLSPTLRGLARAGGYEAVDASRHSARADGVNELMFGSGASRRLVAVLDPDGVHAEQIIPGGQSGVLTSPHYADQLGRWLTNDYHPVLLSAQDVLADAATQLNAVPACVPASTTLCLRNGRFKAELQWDAPELGSGPGLVVPGFSNASGNFYFFDGENWEILVKVLDGCAINQHFWIFASAATDVGWELTVEDTESGGIWSASNPLGQRSPAITDTMAFATCP